MMRKLLYALLTNDVGITELFGNRIYEKGSVPDKPVVPFIMTRFLASRTSPGIPVRVQDRLVDISLYGYPNDFTLIERGMLALQGALHKRTGVFLDDPELGKLHLIESSFQGAGEDLEDPDYRAQLKIATYRIVGSTQ